MTPLTIPTEDFPSKLKQLPTIVIDSREQAPLPISRLPTVRAGLVTGDYSIVGAENHFAVERKSIADLVASVTTERERFERELVRIRGYEFRRLLIVGTKQEIEQHKYRSNTSSRAVLASLAAFDARFGPVVFAENPQIAAQLVERWAAWFAYSLQSISIAISHNKNGSTRGSEQSQKLEPSRESSVNEASIAESIR